MKNCNITKTFPRADIQALCQLFKNTVNNSAVAVQYGSSCVKWTNGTLPENMKISKLLLFKERHNFAQKKCAVHRSKKSNDPFLCEACMTLSRMGSTLQGLLGQLFTNIYFFRQVNSHVMTLQRYFVLGCHHTCTLEGFSLWITLNSRAKKNLLLVAVLCLFQFLSISTLMIGNSTLEKTIFQELLLTWTFCRIYRIYLNCKTTNVVEKNQNNHSAFETKIDAESSRQFVIS